MIRAFKPGDPVIYRVTKSSVRPGHRAVDVMPAQHGDTYRYHVEKFWRVKRVQDDGTLLLYTRRGKEHVCDPSDTNLKRPGLLKRIMYRGRFPKPGSHMEE